MAPLVKPLSKASVATRLGGILGLFKNLTFKLASALTFFASEGKEGIIPSKGNSMES